MNVSFRNVELDPTSPVATWPYEAVVTVIERGTIGDWLVLTLEMDRDPWGPVARQIEEYLSYSRPYGVAPLLERAVIRARRQAEASERAEVAATVAGLVTRSGLSMGELAEHIGTSRTRLSTYRSGKVVPSAALLVRLRGVVSQIAGSEG